MDKWIEKIHSIRTFISRERKKKKKKRRKETKNNRPSPSPSFPLFLLSVFPRTTREGNEREDYPISANILSPCTTRHDVAISSHVEPRLREKKRRVQVSGSTSEVTRRVEVGWWLTLFLRASRRRRHLCATPPLFQRPPRHTDPYRRIYTPPPLLLACALYPRLPTNSLPLSDVHLSGVEHKVGDRLSPTLPPDAIRYIPWRIVHEGGEDDGIVAGWEVWGRWELEISSLPDFDVDRLSRAREFQVCASFLNVSFHGVICNLSEPEGVEVEVALNFEFFFFRIGEFYKYEFGKIRFFVSKIYHRYHRSRCGGEIRKCRIYGGVGYVIRGERRRMIFIKLYHY